MTNSYPYVVFGDEFKGKRVLMTGGTKGVGEAIVRRFELSGASVAITARSAPLQAWLLHSLGEPDGDRSAVSATWQVSLSERPKDD